LNEFLQLKEDISQKMEDVFLHVNDLSAKIHGISQTALKTSEFRNKNKSEIENPSSEINNDSK
jgi:hypothetical protein